MRRLRRQIVVGRHRTRIGLWLLPDILRFSRWDSLRVVLLELAGRGGALRLARPALRLRPGPAGAWCRSGVPLWETVELPIRDVFMVGVLLGVLLMGLGSILQFRVRLDAVQVAEHYERFCGRGVLALASRLPSPKAGWATRMAGRESVNLFFAYSRTCGFVTRQIVMLLPSFVGPAGRLHDPAGAGRAHDAAAGDCWRPWCSSPSTRSTTSRPRPARASASVGATPCAPSAAWWPASAPDSCRCTRTAPR